MNYIIKFFKFIIKEIFSFFIKLFLLFGLIIVCVTIFLNKTEDKMILRDSYLVIDCSQPFSEQSYKTLLGGNSISFFDLLTVIDYVKTDRNILGVVLDLNNVTLSTTQINELGEKLKELKDYNKHTFSFMDSANNKNLLLSSYTDQTFMPESKATQVNISPYFSEEYYPKALMDKIGISFNVINIGDYKSYGQNLVSENMSPENREFATRINDKIYKNFIEEISKNKNLNKSTISQKIENGDFIYSNSNNLFDNQLISGYGNIASFHKENEKSNINFINLDEYTKHINLNFAQDNIVVLVLEGNIYDEQPPQGFVYESYIIADEVISALDRMQEDDSVRGVVLRIDSPGGSAYTADIISKRVKEFAKTKPIYVSMGSVAASGGYYIAANANKIFANNNTITGSIGVVSILPNYSKLINNAGINVETIKKGKYSDIYSLSLPFTEEKYNKIRESNLEVYDEFLDVVSIGRHIQKEKVHDIAQGKIWTGSEGKEIGLVDEIGGLDDTIKALAEDLKLDRYASLQYSYDRDMKSAYKKYFNFFNFIKTKKSFLKFAQDTLFMDETLLNKPITYTEEYINRR